jgi:multidrug transporter EmrE-like cation transporter
MEQQTGKYIIMAGIGIVVVGLVWYFFGNRLHWLGRLPGDIRIEREGFRFYFPLTTMVLLSLLISGVLNILRRFL